MNRTLFPGSFNTFNKSYSHTNMFIDQAVTVNNTAANVHLNKTPITGRNVLIKF